jgi:hypothetical protein
MNFQCVNLCQKIRKYHQHATAIRARMAEPATKTRTATLANVLRDGLAMTVLTVSSCGCGSLLVLSVVLVSQFDIVHRLATK